MMDSESQSHIKGESVQTHCPIEFKFWIVGRYSLTLHGSHRNQTNKIRKPMIKYNNNEVVRFHIRMKTYLSEEEEMMREEEDMEIEPQVFVAHEIDLDYEFDAVRFFDFCAQETSAQARQAELWFQSAGSYPPSPFVAKLVVREDDVSASPESERPECATTVYAAKSGIGFSRTVFHHDGMQSSSLGHGSWLTDAFYVSGSKAGGGSGSLSALLSGVPRDVNMKMLQVTTGLTFNSKTISENLNSKVKSAAMKGSTLMKPTASQLAKQNRAPQIVSSRFQKVQDHNRKMDLSTSSGIECQAAKRQKLEGGLLHKVGDVKQQVNFVHKAPKKVATVDQNSGHSKLKITIPREPDLETAHRAQRIRPKNAAEAEVVVTVAVPRFKARPLNRKILNAPSLPLSKRSTPRLPEFQEFHLKTQERAMQHTSATSSSSLHFNDSDKVNLVHTILSSNVNVSSHHCILSKPFILGMKFLKLQLLIDIISNLWETEVCWLQDLDKHTAFSAQENRIRDLRRIHPFHRPSAMGAPKHDGLDFINNFKARPLNKKILTSKGDIGVFRNRKQETTVPMEFNFHTEKRVQHNPPIELFSKMSLTSEVQSNNGSQLRLPRHSRVFREEMPFVFGGKQIHSGREGCDGEAGYSVGCKELYSQLSTEMVQELGNSVMAIQTGA
ncbi:Protein TPX2, partial [Mucuna pruriens]